MTWQIIPKPAIPRNSAEYSVSEMQGYLRRGAEALDLYAKTGSKARVRDFLFPKHRPAKRPGRPVRGAEAGGDALGIQPAAHGAAASAHAAG